MVYLVAFVIGILARVGFEFVPALGQAWLLLGQWYGLVAIFILMGSLASRNATIILTAIVVLLGFVAQDIIALIAALI